MSEKTKVGWMDRLGGQGLNPTQYWSWVSRCTPVTPVLECQGQENQYKLEAGLVNTVRSSPMTELHSDTLSTNKQNKTKNALNPMANVNSKLIHGLFQLKGTSTISIGANILRGTQPRPCLFIQAERTMKSALGDKNLSAKTNLWTRDPETSPIWSHGPRPEGFIT